MRSQRLFMARREMRAARMDLGRALEAYRMVLPLWRGALYALVRLGRAKIELAIAKLPELAAFPDLGGPLGREGSLA
jgi:hypothetical protein